MALFLKQHFDFIRSRSEVEQLQRAIVKTLSFWSGGSRQALR